MNRTMKYSVLIGTIALAVLAYGSLRRTNARQVFTNATIEGSWGFHAFGNNTNRGVAIVAVGRIIYDGQGGCEVRDTINFDAEGAGAPPIVPPPTGISRVSSECDYHTEPDGSGAVHIQFFGPGANGAIDEVHLAFVIEDNANAMRLVRTDQVALAQGTSFRQNRRHRDDD